MENITQSEVDNLAGKFSNMSIAQLKGILKTLAKIKTQEAKDAIKIVRDVIAIKKGRLNVLR